MSRKLTRFELKLMRTLARNGVSKHAAGWKGWQPPRHKKRQPFVLPEYDYAAEMQGLDMVL